MEHVYSKSSSESPLHFLLDALNEFSLDFEIIEKNRRAFESVASMNSFLAGITVVFLKL